MNWQRKKERKKARKKNYESDEFPRNSSREGKKRHEFTMQHVSNLFE